jgi:DeoR family transcriptional regulator, fructose operon transcriptional repressor
LLAIDRKMRLIEYIKQNRTATISELAKEFNVHEVTIRRDLAEIEQKGILKRTHGGVIMEQWTKREPPFAERTSLHLDTKMKIGKKAASLVEDGQSLMMDTGTTTLHIAKNLKNHKDLTVVTNDINIAAELRDVPRIKVILTGGELHPFSYFLNGMFTDHVLKSLHVEKAFISAAALHPQYGLTNPDMKLISVKQEMIGAAGEIIVVADDSKIGKLSLHKVAPNSSIHTLITGKEASESQLQEFRDIGITVYAV